MATAGISAKNLSDAEHSVQLRRAVVASTVGSVIEYGMIFCSSAHCPIGFRELYFPSSDPLVGTLQAFGRWTLLALYPARSARRSSAITATVSGAR